MATTLEWKACAVQVHTTTQPPFDRMRNQEADWKQCARELTLREAPHPYWGRTLPPRSESLITDVGASTERGDDAGCGAPFGMQATISGHDLGQSSTTVPIECIVQLQSHRQPNGVLFVQVEYQVCGDIVLHGAGSATAGTP